MRKMKKYLFCTLNVMCLMQSAHASHSNIAAQDLMTAHDMARHAFSNITITNSTGQTILASGLFIASFDVNDCSACNGNIAGGDNAGGAVVSPFTFQAGQTVPIGQNYLYNMLYNGIYYIRTIAGTSPCSLPGCSWPGDNSDVHGWCITLNAMSRHASYTYANYTNGSNPAANAPSYGAAGNSTPFDYKYDLINPTTLGGGNACLGPITCNDQTLTCQVNAAQNETFQPYSDA